MSGIATGENKASELFTLRFVSAAIFFEVTVATVWALIQDAPILWRLATLPPAALAALFFSLSVREVVIARRRIFDRLAIFFGIVYVGVATYALINWYGGIPLSLWRSLINGAGIGLLTLLFVSGIIILVREYRAERISKVLCWSIVCLESALAAVLVAGFLAYRSIRADIQHYAMPRHLEPDKIEAISNYLLKFSPHALTICYDVFDSEASEYANQIRTAAFDGGWTINNCPEPAQELRKQMPDAPDAPITQKQLWSFWAVLTNPIPRIEGLRLDTQRSQRLSDEINKRNQRPDPKNPNTDILLQDALNKGGVEIPQRGGGGLPLGSKDEEILTLTVGPKPRTYSPPMIFKIVPQE